MKKLFAIFLFTTLFGLNSFACLNYYYSLNRAGKLVVINDWETPFNTNFNPELNVSKLKKLEARLKKEKNYMLLSDYSVCLLKLGKTKEALEILKQLYVHYPTDYKLAANLGTAYELNGQADSALKYIKRDMQLNPKDHDGSEWVHVKVLETKLALQKDPAYLNNHTVLQLDEKSKHDSATLKQLYIQICERFPFTPGLDAIMASLFTDLGDIMANVKSIEYARAYYQISKNYYGNKSPVLDDKIKEMNKLIYKYASVHPDSVKPTESVGMRHKLGGVAYKTLLDDNNRGYVVNWSKVNTNISSLLAMVDFTMTEEQAKKATDKQNDGLKLISEHKQ